MTDTTSGGQPSTAEIAALTARLRALTIRGAADPAERAPFLAGKHALIDRITTAERADDPARARAEAGGYALVGPSAHAWRADPATGRPVEPKHQAVRKLLGRDELTTADAARTDGDMESVVVPLADETDLDHRAEAHADSPTAEPGLTGAEGPPIDAGPTLSAEEAAHELAAEGRSLDEARALVRGYLDDVSEQVGTSVHRWGLDAADLAAMRADPIDRARAALDVLAATTEGSDAATTAAERVNEDGWSR